MAAEFAAGEGDLSDLFAARIGQDAVQIGPLRWDRADDADCHGANSIDWSGLVRPQQLGCAQQRSEPLRMTRESAPDRCGLLRSTIARASHARSLIGVTTSRLVELWLIQVCSVGTVATFPLLGRIGRSVKLHLGCFTSVQHLGKRRDKPVCGVGHKWGPPNLLVTLDRNQDC
jgi:hypothetical protein